MRIDSLIYNLCEEIDTLKEDVEYWKSKYEEMNKKYNDSLDASIKYSHKMGLSMVAIATNDRELSEKIANSD